MTTIAEAPLTEPKMIRLSYMEGETGWAEDLGDGRVRIANCPLNPELRYGDICSTKPTEDDPNWLMVDEILERSFDNTATIWYSDNKYFYLIKGGSRIAGWEVEGGVGADESRTGGSGEGFLTINYNGEECDLDTFLEELCVDALVRVTRPSDETEDED